MNIFFLTSVWLTWKKLDPSATQTHISHMPSECLNQHSFLGIMILLSRWLWVKITGKSISESILARIKVIIACTKGFPNNDIMGIPLNTCSSAILLSITSVVYYFRIQTFIERCLWNHYIKFGGHPPQSWIMVISSPPAVKLKLAAILSTCSSAILFGITNIIISTAESLQLCYTSHPVVVIGVVYIISVIVDRC